MIKFDHVVNVKPHPTSDNPMDIVTMSSGLKNVANRDDGSGPRYEIGDTAIVIPENYLLPEWLLKHNGLWNEEKGKGYLKGSKGNRTCVKNIAGEPSEVMLVKVEDFGFGEFDHELGGTYQVEFATIKNVNGVDIEVSSENLEKVLEVSYWQNPNK